MLIEKDLSLKDKLKNKIVLIIGAGDEIGLETVKALIYMGAKVIIAESDKQKLIYAEVIITDEFGESAADFYEIDFTDEKQIYALAAYIKEKYKFLDVLFNNAAMNDMEVVDEVSIDTWDKSYAVNFRTPLLLTQSFLPLMKHKNLGTIVFAKPFGAVPFVGAYETFKTVQMELCTTLFEKLKKTKIRVYSIAPEPAQAETAQETGTGFAISVLMANSYNGQKITSTQVLMDYGLLSSEDENNEKDEINNKDNNDYEELIPAILNVINEYDEQYSSWMEQNIFQRQLVLHNFKKIVGYSANEFLEILQHIECMIFDKTNKDISPYFSEFKKLMMYYERQYKSLQEAEKNTEKVKENSKTIQSYINNLKVIVDGR